MKIKALKSFIGRLQMNVGAIREVADEEFAKELIKTGKAIEVKDEKNKQEEKQVEVKKTQTKKAKKK